MHFKLGELFSGPGGIGLAAKQAKVRTNGTLSEISHVWANDYDKDSCHTYRKNILTDNPDAVICEDIRKLDYDRLKKISDIDALAFGFPCNDFSVVGKQKGMNRAYGPLYEFGVK